MSRQRAYEIYNGDEILDMSENVGKPDTGIDFYFRYGNSEPTQTTKILLGRFSND